MYTPVIRCYVPYYVTVLINLAPIWHHTRLLEHYWLYSLCCTLLPYDYPTVWLSRLSDIKSQVSVVGCQVLQGSLPHGRGPSAGVAVMTQTWMMCQWHWPNKGDQSAISRWGQRIQEGPQRLTPSLSPSLSLPSGSQHTLLPWPLGSPTPTRYPGSF